MDLTQSLRNEHQLILRVLDCFESALRSTPAPDRSVVETFTPFIEFFRGFADAYHHQKEEGHLFPALVRAGLPQDGGPVGCMLQEHAMGRAHVEALAAALEAAEAGDAQAVSTIETEGAAYVDMLRDHIAKEDTVLFMMAAEIIGDADAARLAGEMSALEATAESTSLAARGEGLAEQLIAEYTEAVAQE